MSPAMRLNLASSPSLTCLQILNQLPDVIDRGRDPARTPHHQVQNVPRLPCLKTTSRSLTKSGTYSKLIPILISSVYHSTIYPYIKINSTSQFLDNSGARVHELSAPLAAAGISILYQSSYLSDFIFVRHTNST